MSSWLQDHDLRIQTGTEDSMADLQSCVEAQSAIWEDPLAASFILLQNSSNSADQERKEAKYEEKGSGVSDLEGFCSVNEEFGVLDLDGCHLGTAVGEVSVFQYEFMREAGYAELDVMVAEEKARRRGLGQAAVKILMGFLLSLERFAELNSFEVKIRQDNIASLKLFQKKLGFVEDEERYNAKFGEKTLVLQLNPELRKSLVSQVSVRLFKLSC